MPWRGQSFNYWSWKHCGKMCEEDVQLSRPRSKSEIAQWHRKERWWCCLFYQWDAQAQHAAVFGDLADSFTRSLLQAGRAFKRIDIDGHYETSIKHGTRERWTKVSQPVRRMTESRVIILPAKWETWSHPKINKADVVLATHTTDTSWPDDFSWWWFQRCHSNWVPQPRYRHKPFGGLSWGGRYEGVPPVNNRVSSNFVASQDTDVAVLMLAHFDKRKCPKIWIKR